MKNAHKKSDAHQNKKTQNNCVARLMVKAQHYFEQNQLQQANCLYQEVLQQQPKNILALNALAVIAMKVGMLTVATELLNAAVEIDPQHLAVNKNLARVYSRMSRYDEAMLQYIGILDIDENDNDAHRELARLNLQAGNPGIALTHYQCVLKVKLANLENLHRQT